MTTIIPHIRSGVAGGISLSATTDRVVPVNRQAFTLFNRIGLVPPDSGPFDPAALDEHLDKSGISISERMQVKSHLRHAGLLVPGRYIDDTAL